MCRLCAIRRTSTCEQVGVKKSEDQQRIFYEEDLVTQRIVYLFVYIMLLSDLKEASRFIIKLFETYNGTQSLYFLLEPALGGGGFTFNKAKTSLHLTPKGFKKFGKRITLEQYQLKLVRYQFIKDQCA